MKAEDIIKDIAKKTGRPIPVIEKVVRSQFECARESTEKGLNIRFPYIGMLYNRNNKNPEYLEHRKKINNA